MAQFARPDSTVLAGSWVTGSAALWQAIDEVTASDADFISSSSGPVNDLTEMGLSDVTDPVSSSGHLIRFRHAENGAVTSANMVLRVRLLQGATVIAERSFNGVGTSYVTDATFTLTSGEADAITDYTNLRIEFRANQSAGTARRKNVSWAELEVPDAPVSGTQAIVIADGFF